MKYYTLFFICFLSINQTNAQSFSKTYKINTIGQVATQPRAGEAQYAIATNDGGFLIAGRTPTVQGGGYHPFLLKIDASGDSLWSKIYDYWNDAYPFKFFEDDNGDLKMAINALIPGPDYRAILYTLNPVNGDTVSGQMLPKHQLCNSLGAYYDIEILSDGSMFLSYRDDQSGTTAAMDIGQVYKINAQGNITWRFENDGTNDSYQFFRDIYWDGNNLICTGMEVAVTNTYQGEWVVSSLDTSGQLNWTKTLFGPNTNYGYRYPSIGNTVISNGQGQYLVGGSFKYDNPRINGEGTVVRISATGDSLNSSRISASREINHIIPDGQGGFLATGEGLLVDSSGSFVKYFDKALLARLSANGILGEYVLRGDTNSYSNSFGGQTNAYYWSNAVIPTGQGDYLMLGSGFRNKNSGSNIQVTAAFRLAAPSIGLHEQKDLSGIDLYPNPADAQFMLDLPEDYSGEAISIYNVMGQLIKTFHYQPNHPIDISTLRPGAYILKIGSSGHGTKITVY